MKKRIAIYCRVSTYDQEKGMKSQEKALKDYCVQHQLNGRIWYRDRITGSKTDRPAFKRLQHDIFIGKINTVVVWKLDRLSRSLPDGIKLLTDWLKQGIRIISISQQIDFNGAVGEMIAGVLFAVAAMERENLRENTKRGIAAARSRGAILGKRPRLFAKQIVPLLKQGMTMKAIGEKLQVTPQAIYDCLEREDVDPAKLRRQNG